MMLVLANGKMLCLGVGAALALLACQTGLRAQIGKVNCQDQPCPTWLPPPAKLLECLPCKHKQRPALNQYFGYYPNTWRLWPGTKPNSGYVEPEGPRKDLLLNYPTRLPDGASGGAKKGSARGDMNGPKGP
jgi:hypothetical protein